jgi:predicted Zn-dependent protease
MVVPVLGLLDMAYFAVAPVSNHLQYLALAAPCALAGAGLAMLYRRLPYVAVAAGAVVSLVLAVDTQRRAAAFEDDLRLWEAASRDSPRSLYAASSHAEELAARVSIGAAVAELEAFTARSPDEADRRLARAHALVYLRRPSEAAAEALASAGIRPDVQRQIEIGRALVTAGFPGDAIRVLSAQAARSPRSADVRYWLGAALWRAGRPSEARQAIEEGLRASPRDPKLVRALGLFEARP